MTADGLSYSLYPRISRGMFIEEPSEERCRFSFLLRHILKKVRQLARIVPGGRLVTGGQSICFEFSIA
jgi:hypothetical protein